MGAQSRRPNPPGIMAGWWLGCRMMVMVNRTARDSPTPLSALVFNPTPLGFARGCCPEFAEGQHFVGFFIYGDIIGKAGFQLPKFAGVKLISTSEVEGGPLTSEVSKQLFRFSTSEVGGVRSA
jgi:hypothetical protein